MKIVNKLKDRKGVSPVIATVIIVAVTITVAVAVAYWMSGIAGQYTSFEKVEIQNAECTFKPLVAPVVIAHWEITIDLKNSGTKTAVLTDVFVNDAKAVLAVAAPVATTTGITAYLNKEDDGLGGYDPIPLQIESGATSTVIVYIISGETLTSGTTVNIKIHSAAGMDYIKLVQL